MRDCLIIGLALTALALLGYGNYQRNQADDARAEAARLQQVVDDQVAAVDTAQHAAEAWRVMHTAADAALRECVGEWDRARQTAAAAAAHAQAAREQLRAALADFQRRWNQRGVDCNRALYAMRDACAVDIGSF